MVKSKAVDKAIEDMELPINVLIAATRAIIKVVMW